MQVALDRREVIFAAIEDHALVVPEVAVHINVADLLGRRGLHSYCVDCANDVLVGEFRYFEGLALLFLLAEKR